MLGALCCLWQGLTALSSIETREKRSFHTWSEQGAVVWDVPGSSPACSPESRLEPYADRAVCELHDAEPLHKGSGARLQQ